MSEEEVVMAREAEVNQLRGDSYGSLSKSLENPPAGSKNLDVKDMNARIVWGVIAGISDGEIDGVIDKLSMEVRCASDVRMLLSPP